MPCRRAHGITDKNSPTVYRGSFREECHAGRAFDSSEAHQPNVAGHRVALRVQEGVALWGGES